MAYKGVLRVEISELIRRWRAGHSQRRIATGTGLSRDTVSRYIAAAQALGASREGPELSEEQLSRLAAIGQPGPRQVETPSEELLAPWADQIHRWLTGDRLQMTRIQELLGQRNCRVSYASLQRFVARRHWRRPRRLTVRMEDTPPGEVAEMDFGRLGLLHDPATGHRRAVWALLVVLGYSRHSFLWPTHSQKLEDVIAGLESAWACSGGIPKYLVIDNCPPAVATADPLHPVFTRGFLEYSQHRGFIVDSARARHPKDKPKVERSVPYARERFFKGGEFQDLADVRGQTQRWCRDVAGLRIHGTTYRQPLMVFQDEERQALLPWDGEPYEIADWREAKVHQDHHIQCLRSLYSIPSSLCPPGQKVEVRVDSKLVRIYHRGQLIKTHVRQPRGGRSTDNADYPAELSAYTTRAPDRIKASAKELGPSVAEFADRLFEGPLPWAKVRQGHKLLRLGERYTAKRLDAACRRALEVDLIDVTRLERILVQALEEETTPKLPESLPEGRFARPGSAFSHTNQYRRTA